MSKALLVDEAKSIMGHNFIGPEELSRLGFVADATFNKVLPIEFSKEELEKKKDNYILIYGINKLKDGSDMTIRNLLKVFGKDPDVSEPCFYNQDWYLKEDFIDTPLREGWFLIRKSVYEDSRAVDPLVLNKKYNFPTAIKCVYSFFVAWYALNEKLWYHDFVWCNDVDHNGDRIYVGKYNDIDQVNKNGFSIHRHLGLRKCYACID